MSIRPFVRVALAVFLLPLASSGAPAQTCAPVFKASSINRSLPYAYVDQGNAQAGARSSQPDFSGEWVLVNPTNPAADVATALSVRQPVVDKTVWGATMPPAYLELIVERRFPGGVRSERYRIGVEGGTVGPMPASVRVETRESVKWVGNSLIIATSSWSGPRRAVLGLDRQRSEAWQLDSDGGLVIMTTEQDGSRESQTTLTYRRR